MGGGKFIPEESLGYVNKVETCTKLHKKNDKN
jgi:hypothetical protein